MAEEKKIATGYIGNALRSAANNHTTTFSDEIFDTERQKYQNEVTTELETTDNEIKADIAAETTRAQAAEQANTQAIADETSRAMLYEQEASQFYGNLKTVNYRKWLSFIKYAKLYSLDNASTVESARIGFAGFNPNSNSVYFSLYINGSDGMTRFSVPETVESKPTGIAEYILDSGNYRLHIKVDWDNLSTDYLYDINSDVCIDFTDDLYSNNLLSTVNTTNRNYLYGNGIIKYSSKYIDYVKSIVSLQFFSKNGNLTYKYLTYWGWNNNRIAILMANEDYSNTVVYVFENEVAAKPNGIKSYTYLSENIVVLFSLNWDALTSNYFNDNRSDIEVSVKGFYDMNKTKGDYDGRFIFVRNDAVNINDIVKHIDLKDYNYDANNIYQLGFIGFNGFRISAIVYKGESNESLLFVFEQTTEKPTGIKSYFVDNGETSMYVSINWDFLPLGTDGKAYWGVYADKRVIIPCSKKEILVNDYSGGSDKFASAETVKNLKESIVNSNIFSQYYNKKCFPINSLPKNPERLNILVLGNSYTANIFTHLKSILANLGITNVTFARTFNPGGTLGEEAASDYLSLWNDMVVAGSVFRDFWIHDSETGYDNSYNYKYTLDEVLALKNWDIVIFQNGSSDSADYDLYQPYLNYCIEYVLSKCKNTVCLGFNMTWSWGSKSPLYKRYPLSGGDQANMDKGIMTAAQNVCIDTGINYMCSAGFCIQELRKTKYNSPYIDDDTIYEFMESNKNGEARHVVGAIGLFTIGLAFAETYITPLFGKSIKDCTLTIADSVYNMPVTNENRGDLINIALSSCRNHYSNNLTLLNNLITIRGRVVSETVAIEGAIINIVNEDFDNGNLSVYSKADGTFKISIPKSDKTSTVTIKATGYANKEIAQIISASLDLGDIELNTL